MNRGDVLFCPGGESHVKMRWRAGFSDLVIRHGDLAREDGIHHTITSIGAAAAMVPVQLQPGESWEAEFGFRRYSRRWRKPAFEPDHVETITESPFGKHLLPRLDGELPDDIDTKHPEGEPDIPEPDFNKRLPRYMTGDDVEDIAEQQRAEDAKELKRREALLDEED